MKAIKPLSQSRNILIVFLLFSIVGCVSIAPFSQQAYIQTTSIKVDALNTMDLAQEEFVKHVDAIKALQTQLQKAYEYEKNRPKNDITVKLWDDLLNKDGHLLGGFIKRWETEGKLNVDFIVEEKKLVDKAFDIIAGLESKKLKSTDL